MIDAKAPAGDPAATIKLVKYNPGSFNIRNGFNHVAGSCFFGDILP